MNYSFLNYTNKTHSCGEKDLPALYCKTEVYPDFLALYSEPSLYHKTDRTGVCFYQFDSVFDGRRGLYEAIYHDDTARLAYFKKRFEGVKFFISPDYSEFGDIHVIENEYRLFKARVVAIWFIVEIGAVVIPNVSFPTEKSASYEKYDDVEYEYFIGFDDIGDMDESDYKWKVFARVSVNRVTGEVTILDYKLPNGKRMENPIKPTSFA